MDNLKNVTILHSLSSCDLNTNFNDKCHIDWSKSNLISIVTLNGIYILKPQLEIQHGPFRIELIRNPATRFKHQPVGDTWPTFDTMWQTLNVNQYMEVYMDPALMTNIERLSLDLYPRRFRIAKWSPVIEAFPKHCILAAITTDYQLLIFTRKYNTWVVQDDLSSEYDKLWAQYHETDNIKQGSNFTAIQNDLHSLSFCDICWKETRESGPILLATTIPGDIVVWQVVVQKSDSHGGGGDTLTESKNIKLEARIILRTHLHYISSMHMFQNLLIVSARDGQVVLFDLTTNLDKLVSDNIVPDEHSNSSIIDNVKLINIPTTATIWHGDNIEVTDFYLQPISSEAFRIVLAKSTKICWCTINYSQKTDDGTATLSISDTFSAIDGLDPDSTLFQTPATCLKPAGDRKGVLIADDGSFLQLEFIDNREDSSPEINAIRTGRVDLSRMIPRGLCTSPQGNSITMISCISLIYDSSKILAPAKLVLLPLINDRVYFIDCFHTLFDENWLKKEDIKSPMDVCDRIDYIRSVLPTLNHTHSYDIYKFLKKVISEIRSLPDAILMIKLKIAVFLLLKLRKINRTKMIEDMTDDCEEKLCNFILIYNLKLILSAIVTDYSDDKVFTVDQINSLRNIFAWLNMSPEGTALRETYKDKFKFLETRYSHIHNECCSICQEDIPFVSISHGTCTNGHRFSRCARSLLILNPQITRDELVCEHCERRYLADLLWPTTELWLCSYCQ